MNKKKHMNIYVLKTVQETEKAQKHLKGVNIGRCTCSFMTWEDALAKLPLWPQYETSFRLLIAVTMILSSSILKITR